jgi:hypothetical protein
MGFGVGHQVRARVDEVVPIAFFCHDLTVERPQDNLGEVRPAKGIKSRKTLTRTVEDPSLRLIFSLPRARSRGMRMVCG